MNFPVYVSTYEISGRVYRRNMQTTHSYESENDFEIGDTSRLNSESDMFDTSDELMGSAEGKLSKSESSDIMTTDAGESTEIDEKTDKEDFTVKYDSKTKKWSARLHIPVILRRFVIGPKGALKKKIEEETECRLIFPSRKKKKHPIEIISIKSEESVERCRDRIELLLLGARGRATYNSFVSIFMATPQLKKQFEKFIDTIISDDELSESCRQKEAFQEPGKLHLTITMLSLLDDDERKAATNSLKETMNKVRDMLREEKLEVEVKGLEIMNDDPSRARVLYACIQSEKLQNMANILAEAMSIAGYSPQQDKVKIHLTLMNSRYLWEKKRQKERIDVTKLLEKYRDYTFGRVVISEVQISSLTGPKDETGYYESIASVTIGNEEKRQHDSTNM